MYVFLHVPKTAGTTLRVLFGDVYGNESIFMAYRYKSLRQVADAYNDLPTDQKKQYALISGHHEFGLHKLLAGDTRYLTLFRDPIDRVVSTYYFMKGGHGLEPSPIFKKRPSMSLKEFVESGVTGEVDNGMVRQLSGNLYAPLGQVSDEDLETAKTNLRERVEAFGFSEDFNEALVLFGRKLGWDRVPLYRKENITPRRPAMDQISAREMAVIEDRCRLDIELHKYARHTTVERFGPRAV